MMSMLIGLNHRVTVGLILIGVFITVTTSFITNRISCWIPAELKRDSYTKYVHDYCWITNTYYIHSNVTPPHADEDRRRAEIGKDRNVRISKKNTQPSFTKVIINGYRYYCYLWLYVSISLVYFGVRLTFVVVLIFKI